MRLLRFHASIVLFCSALPAFAADNGAFDEAVTALAGHFKKYVRVIPRPIHTYNYSVYDPQQLPRTASSEAKTEFAQKRIEKLTNLFFHEAHSPSDRDVAGFYLANDATASRSFGKDQWMLIRVELPKGLRALDLSNYREEESPENPVAKKLQAAGCDEFKLYKIPRKYTDQAVCRDIGRAVLQKLGVDLFAYDWLSADFPLCQSGRPDTAYIVLNSDAVPKSGIKVFSSELPLLPDEAEEAKVLQELHRRAQANANDGPGNITIEERKKLKFWNPPLEAPSEGTLRSWVSQHLEGCHTSRAPAKTATGCPQEQKHPELRLPQVDNVCRKL